jgi:transposase
MRQTHRAGEKRLVDDAGQRIPVVNRHRGEGHEAVLVVAVLGASRDTEAEATWPQRLPDWIGSHVRTCAALGGVPAIVVPDHRNAAVTRAHRDAPESNRTDTDLAPHAGCAVIPARAAKPREKATVDVGGPVVERWRLARLRPHPCCARAEVHAALFPRLSTLQARPFKTRPGSRPALFDTLERPALRPLPAQPEAFAEWTLAHVTSDDHGEVEGHDDSVPYAVVRQPLDVRLRASGVECFAKGPRVASHRRSPHQGRHRTVAGPMPRAPHHDADWTPQRLIHGAATSGPATPPVVDTRLASRPHPHQGFRAG